MSKTITEFYLSETRTQSMSMPPDSQILCVVGYTNPMTETSEVHLFAEHLRKHESEPELWETRVFHMFSAFEDIPEELILDYIDSIQLGGTVMHTVRVKHVYEEIIIT